MKISSILMTLLSLPGIHVANANGAPSVNMGWGEYSVENGYGFLNRRGRRLKESEVASHDCVGESYGLSLFIVEGHVGLVAEPECVGSTNKECECPFLFFHASSGDGEGVETGFLEKEIIEFSQIDREEDQEMFWVGSVPLGTLVEAFENASMEETKYDLFLNNCAGLLINMLRHLDIDPTNRDLITFAARQLSKSDFIINEMSKSDFGVEDFVSAYVHDQF